MADTTKARSEARRKKILENAEKRINRINSRQRQEHKNSYEEDDDSKTKEPPNSQQWQCDKCGNINFGNRKDCLLCRSEQPDNEQENSEEAEIQPEVNKIQENFTASVENFEKTDRENSKERPLVICADQSTLRPRRGPFTVKIQRAEISQGIPAQEEVFLPQSANTQPAKKLPYSQNQLFEIYRILGCILIAFVSHMVLKSGYGLFYFETIFLPFTAFQIGLYLFKHNFLKLRKQD